MPANKLPENAYEIAPGEQYVPYTHGQSLTEFTIKAVLIGAFLGMVFGGANTYLGLKAGLTISTSIPVAVLTVVAFKLLGLCGVRHNILELNMSQTVGSASSSVASGVLFTIPALFIWGMPPTWRQMTLLATAGGLLGVLAMIPLRRYLIKQEHGNLPYPEGMACAEVLVAAEGGGRRASGVFWGIGIGMLFKLITDGLKLFHSKLIINLPFKAALSVSVSPALMGVGYILGLRIAAVMVSGGLLSALVIIPALNWWGSGLDTPLFPEQVKLIRDMTATEIWNRYVRYIGAGAVATGGILTLIRSIPTMVESFRLGIGQLADTSGENKVQDRTDRDLPLGFVAICVLSILLVLTFVPGILGYLDATLLRALAALLIGVFAFFFVTVSSRIVGLVGVTSNPTSGMTIATLIGTSLIFYLAGWTDMQGKATALMVGTAVCIAASIAGDTSQDLKTGFVLGATPRLQQIGELIGVLTSAGVVCLIIQLLHESVAAQGGLGGPELPAPQGVLMKLVIDGVLDQNLPWSLIMIGGAIAIVAAMFRVPVLAFAVGVYLPLYTMAAVFLGGLLRHLLSLGRSKEETERHKEQGILVGSGLVGGEGLMGVALAAWVVFRGGGRIEGLGLHIPAWADTAFAAIAILVILGLMALMACRRIDTSTIDETGAEP
jgi:putative OPT family oligopeptide transporter